MTNPNNIVRVRARNGGRASVYEANAWCQAFSSGVLEGVGVVQNTSADMNVLVGGSATKPDVLIAENPFGYKIALDIIGQQAIALAAPASNSRISAIVAYTDDIALSTTQSDVTGSPSSCGLIVVNGTATANPVAPTDAQIREAITQDGATGSQASYCVLATITVASNTTIITNSLIANNRAGVKANDIDYKSFQSEILTFTSLDIDSTDTNIKSYSVPEDGLYLFSASVCFLRNGGGDTAFLMWLKHNGANQGNIGSHAREDNTRNAVSGVWSIKAKAGDTITLGGTSVSGKIWANNDYSHICVTRIA